MMRQVAKLMNWLAGSPGSVQFRGWPTRSLVLKLILRIFMFSSKYKFLRLIALVNVKVRCEGQGDMAIDMAIESKHRFIIIS